MAVSYKKLFHMLIDRNMTAAELQKEAGYSANISTRMRRNEYVSLDSIEKICRVLGCKVDDSSCQMKIMMWNDWRRKK